MVFDLDQRKSQLAELETQAEDPDLWNDSENAQDIMRQLSAGRAFVLPFDTLDKRAADLLELVEMAQAESDEAMGREIDGEFNSLDKEYRAFERTLLFSGEYDANNAIFSVNAGAGGTEAQDWAQMMVRAYLRWADRKRFSVEVIEENPGDEAGLKGFSGDYQGRKRLRTLQGRGGCPSVGAHFAVQLAGQTHDEFRQR